MGLLDVIKSFFSDESSAASRYAPPAPPAAEVVAAARAGWEQAKASADYVDASGAAYDLSEKAWLWDEAVAAYATLFERFPAQRGNVATMVGQTLYLGKAGYKTALTDAAKADVYVAALEWYTKAAEANDRSQDLNYVEMCEWLMKSDYRARAQPFVASFDRLFPNNEYRSRMSALTN